jgi:hypothetical protein
VREEREEREKKDRCGNNFIVEEREIDVNR